MQKNLSLLNFKIVKINYKINDMGSGEKFTIIPKINCKMGRKDNKLFVNVSVEIGQDLTLKSPFSLTCEIFGHFQIENVATDEAFLKEAMDVLYPYLRSTVASVTLNCYIPAYNLPILNDPNMKIELVNKEGLN